MTDAIPLEPVRFAGHRGEPIGGLLARPPAPGPAPDGDRRPALVLVQEAFGLDDFMQRMLRRFAAEGYVALAPDLYSREGIPCTKERWTKEDIRSAWRSLPDRRVLGDLEGALEHLARDPAVDPARLGAVGFCMGGNYAYLLGCTSLRLRAVVDFYGRFVYPELSANKPVQPLDLALNLSCPLLAIFGETDPSISIEEVARFRETLERAARDATVVVFPGVGHGFLSERRASHDPRAAARAWELAVDFLREHLIAS